MCDFAVRTESRSWRKALIATLATAARRLVAAIVDYIVMPCSLEYEHWYTDDETED
ncbi:hypothetical protein SAMN04490220_0492 [Rhodococcus jostii]|uniref:Uncharacterized protein n=1 Tax=Rhodococcus jostii TaxID=132919 RepID=A0A1H4IVH9_RHOJO|nr:hypothetical protein SAMN04490220_0492 [Rhodococcus jostii]